MGDSRADEVTPPDEELGARDWDTAARIAVLLEVVQRYAALDFTGAAPADDRSDDLGALAAGITMLGEELEASHAELEQRVAERTAELTALTGRLEDEVTERRRAEQRLETVNDELHGTVAHLRWLNEQVGRLTEMSNLFQVARDRDEAFAVLGQFGAEIFTGTHGEVYVFVASRDALERVATWGGDAPAATTMAPDGCWALRQGRRYRTRVGEGLRCSHVPSEARGRSLCIPLTAQGTVLGLLHLRWRNGADESDGTDTTLEARGEFEGLAIAAGEQFALSLSNLELRAALRSQSIRDALTGLYNRRYFDETLGRELQRAGREDLSVTVLMLDIDRFKSFNDAYGHAAGDAVLGEVATLLLEEIRGEDVACRYGGEELAVIMAGYDPSDAADRAERIRASIAERPFTWRGQPVGHVTVSVGVATFPRHGTTPDQVVRAADAALYEAKNAGRDRVAMARPPEPPPAR